MVGDHPIGRTASRSTDSSACSTELVSLLDPDCPLDRESRSSILRVLRSHPELEADFARLDALCADAGTDNLEQAVELHRMFEALITRRNWSSPEEVLGGRVSYGSLLSVAERRIERAAEPPARILEIKTLLETAERKAAAQPVAAFVEALFELGISDTGMRHALEEAKSGYLSHVENGSESGDLTTPLEL